MTRYSLVIPTNSRPYCLERLFRSLATMDPAPSEIVVGNSTPADAPPWVHAHYERLKAVHRVRWIDLFENCGPAAARKILIGHVTCDYLMLTDDDIVFSNQSSALIDIELLNDYAVIGGVWAQWTGSNYTELADETEALRILESDLAVPDGVGLTAGFAYTFGRLANGQGLTIKSPLSITTDTDAVIGVADVMPNLFAKRSLFDTIGFDDRFLYFFEWYDFSMQAHDKGLRFCTKTSALFYHMPARYAHFASGFHHPRQLDRLRFIDKWNTVPLILGESVTAATAG